MRIGRNCDGTWPSVTFFHHNLVTNSSSGRVEVNSLHLGEFLDQLVFLKVVFRLVLDVVVECADDLGRVVDLGRADGHEFCGDRPGVVMGHAVVWAECDIVSGLDVFAFWEADGIALDNLLCEGLWYRGGGWGGLDAGRER